MEGRIVSFLLVTLFGVGLTYDGCPNQNYESACVLGGAEINNEACDAVVTRLSLATEPTVTVLNAAVDTVYTSVMFDADYKPYQRRGKVYALYITANAKFGGGAQTAILPYRPPNFSKNANVHRIIALVFTHKSADTYLSTPIPDSKRPSFSIASWLYSVRRIVNCVPVFGTQVRVV